MYPHISLAVLCGLFGKTRQGWYQWSSNQENTQLYESIVTKLVVDIRQQINNPRLGTSKLRVLLNEQLLDQGVKVGRDKLYDILRAKGLLVRCRKRKVTTTDSTHPFRRYPNLVKDNLIERPEQVWVSDITYVRLSKGFCYLSLITDHYSRKIVGYCLHLTLESIGPEKALLMALSQRLYPSAKLVHHSDQGVQYCSFDYVKLLKANDILISMSRKGSPQENAIAERVNGILKQEYGLGKTFTGIEQALRAVKQGVDSYNGQRPHRSLNMQTPNQVHQKQKAEQVCKLTSEGRDITDTVNRLKD